MVFRGVRCAVAGVAAAGAVLFATPPDPSAASSPASHALVLESQTAVVTPAAPGQPAPFQITVQIPGGHPAGTQLGLVVYDELSSRSAFQQSLDGHLSGLMQLVAPQPLTSLRPTATGLQFSTTVVAGTAEPDGSSTIGLRGHGSCTAGNSSCSGVYPLQVELLSAGGSVISRLTTYLVYAEFKSASPLTFSWVVPLGAPGRIDTAADLARSIPQLGAGRLKDFLSLTETLATNPSVQASLAPSGSTLQRLETGGSLVGLAVLKELRTIAADGPGRLLKQPYVPFNLAAFSEAGISEEIAGQTRAAGSLLSPVVTDLPAVDQPSWTTWVADGPVSPAITKGMAEVHASHLVLPDADLPIATEEFHASWAQPFSLELGSKSVTAAASDTALSNLFTAEPHDPVLAANQLLAELAMIHFELPNAPQARGVIAVPPASWDPNPQFVSTLVAGLVGNPVVSTATLDGFFATVPAGGNQAQATRRLASGSPVQRVSPTQARQIVAARAQIDAFTRSVAGPSHVAAQLENLLLSSESSELGPSAQRAGLTAFERHLANELAAIHVDTSTVTLTAATASIPITIVSTAAFHLTATLTLQSDKLVFPQGKTRTVNVDHPTNSVTVEVRARTTGDLPLAFKLTAADGALVIASGSMTVRSTATSAVGIILTAVAAAVLVGWWIRTWLRGRRLRRARPVRGATG